MEPDVVRMYSSSPPPLDEDGEEEDEDDFGEFGGYCCDVSSSFSFSEYDTPPALDQSYETGTSPPDLYGTSTRSVIQPGKGLAVEQTEKITKDLEAPYPESLEWETDVAVDGGNGKSEAPRVLLNGPLSSDSQGELCVVSVTGKHSTSALQGFKPKGKDEHSDDPNTDQMGHCLSNGPITVCTGKKLEQLTVTSGNSKESVLASIAAVSSTETGKASTGEGPIDSPQLLENIVFQREVSEVRDTLAGQGVTESQEVDPNLKIKVQSTKEKQEKEETEEGAVPGLCGNSSAFFCEIRTPSGSEDLGDVADASLTPVVEKIPMSDAQFEENVEECNETPVNPGVKGPLVAPGRVELEEDFDGQRVPVVDPAVEEVHDAEAEPVIREVKRIPVGSSVESDEDFGDFRDAAQGFPDVSQTESMSQEGFADFVTALSDCSSPDEFADTDTLKDLKEEEGLAVEDKDKDDDNDDDDDDDNNNHEMMCSELPPSDSFADFSSAPFGGLAGTTGEGWAEFGQHEECEVEQEPWAVFDDEQQSIAATTPANCKLQDLFESTFPLEMAPEDLDVPTLQVLLEPQDHAEISPCHLRESVAMWRHLLDIHSAHGLKVQWVGSHGNRILLDCLGIYNILFTGQSKQPVIVPMFAAGLGMLEPTKEPVKPSSIFSASSPGQGRSILCSQQVASSLSLEDDAPGGAVTHLNLDFFGPVEDRSSDSDTETPMPGVDPELYELTTAKLESVNAGSNVADAFTRLMETVEKNSTVSRKPEQDSEISQEAAQVISLLPDLSFMHARVLMFPSTLTPAASHP